MCSTQYFAVLVTSRPLHFYLLTVGLFAGLSAVLLVLAREQALAAGWFAPELAAEAQGPVDEPAAAVVPARRKEGQAKRRRAARARRQERA
jgi:hypothetical protein